MRIVYLPANGSIERVSTIHGVFLPGVAVEVPEDVARDLLPREEEHRGRLVRRGNIAFRLVEEVQAEPAPVPRQITSTQRGGSIARAASKKAKGRRT
jgi:hypothetical protein